MKRDKEGHYIMIKGSIHKEDITIINTYAPQIEAMQNVRQMLTSMKGKINSNTVIVGDFNTPLTPMDRSIKQKVNKKTQTLNDAIDQLDLIDIYRTFHPQNNEFHLFLKCTWNLLQDRAINLALVNSKILKSFQASFLTIMKSKIRCQLQEENY